MRTETAVILCGGKARRLGSLGEHIPKTLALIRGKPILWYILLRLHQDGFRHFVLPTGFLGEQIQSFVSQEFAPFDGRIDVVETGDDTPIGGRLFHVRNSIGAENFLLVNGDTVFDFDIAGMMTEHAASGCELTLASCHVVSQFGLLFVDASGRVTDFTRDSVVNAFVVPDRHPSAGFINAGIAVLHRSRLDTPGVENTAEFEQFLFPKIIAAGGARHYAIEGFWYAVDTLKDLEAANAPSQSDPRSCGTRMLAEKMSAYAREIGI